MRTPIYGVRVVTCCAAVVSLAVMCVTAGPADAGQEVRRDPLRLDNPIQIYPLPDDALIEHQQYKGVVRRLDARNKETARVKVPAADEMKRWTTLILSLDRSRAMMVHTVEESDFRARHRVAILDTMHLRTVAELPLGKCLPHGTEFPLAAEHVTMICYHSRPPDDLSRKPTLALVTVNLNRGEVVRWFPLGGERRGVWFGPMFFGWTYDVMFVRVGERQSCPFAVEIAEPAAQPVEEPHLLLVLKKSKGPNKGEVWFVSMRHAEPPRRIAVLANTPGSAVSCRTDSSEGSPGRLLLYVEAQPDAKAQSTRVGPAMEQVEVIDVATGKTIGQ